MPKYCKPISWSEFWMWKNKNEEYYTTYILGLKELVSREMKLGSIVHSALEKKDFDWKKALADEGYLPDTERNVQSILDFNFPPIPQREVWLGEKGKIYEEVGYTIAAKADGIDEKQNLIYEFKSGKNFWTQERTDETEQITLYSYIYWKRYGTIPTNILFSLNVSNGKVKMFETKRTKEQINKMTAELRQMIDDLKAKNWFENRVSSYV